MFSSTPSVCTGSSHTFWFLSPFSLSFLVLSLLFQFLFCLSCFQSSINSSEVIASPLSFTLFLSLTASLILSTLMIGDTGISFPQSAHFTMLDSLWSVGLWIMLFVLTASFLLKAVSGGVIMSMTCFREKGSSLVPRNPPLQWSGSTEMYHN